MYTLRLDGAEPGANATVYTSCIVLLAPGTYDVRAVQTRMGNGVRSNVMEGQFTAIAECFGWPLARIEGAAGVSRSQGFKLAGRGPAESDCVE